MDLRIKLIANPIAGGDARGAIARAVACLEGAGAHVELFLTGKRGDAEHAARQTRSTHCDRVLAAGGDGTLNEVANGLVDRDEIPLAFLPLGTANVMAIEMGIPAGIEAACRVALYGEVRPVALAALHGRYFLMMAGIGFDAAAVSAVNPTLKRLTGKFAYVVAGVRAILQYRPQALTLRGADGQAFSAWHVIISNIRHYGGRFVMAPANRLERPVLTACLVERPGRLALLLFWLRIAFRGYFFGAVRRVESVSFELFGTPAPLQIDGDAAGCAPEEGMNNLKISCHAAKLYLVFPPEKPVER